MSVGEALSGVALAKRLKETYPKRPLVVSTTTLTGHALAKERMPFADAVIYFPIRLGVQRSKGSERREARSHHHCSKLKSGLISSANPANAISRHLRQRAHLRPFLRALPEISPPVWLLPAPISGLCSSKCCRLSDANARGRRSHSRARARPRIASRSSAISKYDMSLPDATPLSRWLAEECKRLQSWPVIVAGSVVATEEPLALIAFGVVQGDFRNALLVLAPRKPERFVPAAEFIEESHRKFIRRSELPVPGPGITPKADGNSRWHLRETPPSFCSTASANSPRSTRLADGAFVGGSLVEAGGHNILEPAAFGKVPVFGPSMENFAEIAARFVQAGAAIQVESPEDAGVEWIHLLKDPEKMKRMGDAAKQLVETSRGALDRVMAEVAKQFGGASQ